LAGDVVQNANVLKSFGFKPIVSSAFSDETILLRDETIFRFWRRHPETAGSYWLDKRRRRTTPVVKTGDSQMRTFSFILAFAVVLVGPSLAGSTDNNLPGIGTFAYSGSAIPASAPHTILIAAR
jgi:hypothetical protein